MNAWESTESLRAGLKELAAQFENHEIKDVEEIREWDPYLRKPDTVGVIVRFKDRKKEDQFLGELEYMVWNEIGRPKEKKGGNRG